MKPLVQRFCLASVVSTTVFSNALAGPDSDPLAQASPEPVQNTLAGDARQTLTYRLSVIGTQIDNRPVIVADEQTLEQAIDLILNAEQIDSYALLKDDATRTLKVFVVAAKSNALPRVAPSEPPVSGRLALETAGTVSEIEASSLPISIADITEEVAEFHHHLAQLPDFEPISPATEPGPPNTHGMTKAAIDDFVNQQAFPGTNPEIAVFQLETSEAVAAYRDETERADFSDSYSADDHDIMLMSEYQLNSAVQAYRDQLATADESSTDMFASSAQIESAIEQHLNANIGF